MKLYSESTATSSAESGFLQNSSEKALSSWLDSLLLDLVLYKWDQTTKYGKS